MYIHQLKDWPQFFWDNEGIDLLLTELKLKQKRLIGGMESVGFHFKQETVLETLTLDVIKSSEIEGEILDYSLVRSSVARRLNLENAGVNNKDRNIEGVVEMMLDATQQFHQQLTKKRLLSWHASLFPTGVSGYTKIRVGAWRLNPVQVVSGQVGKEILHFEGPSPKLVNSEMSLFLNWINQKGHVEPLLKAALAHFWFLTIHPFDDGNGRIGRAIADMMLACSEESSHRFYSLSAQIQKERKQYYFALEQTQKGGLDVTIWIKWFLGCLGRAIDHALLTLGSIVRKAHFWEEIRGETMNHRQKKVINLLLDGFEGSLTSSKWAKITKSSQDTAYRDISDLINRGILIKNPQGGRSTSYSLIPFYGESF